MLVKPEGTGNEILDRLCGHAQAVRAEVIAEEIKSPLDPADKGLLRVLFQVERAEHLIHRLDRFPELPHCSSAEAISQDAASLAYGEYDPYP